jgi:hypothetical protein
MTQETLPFEGRPPSRYDGDDICASRHKGSEESEDAWDRIRELAAQSRRRVFRFIRSRGQYGATTDEVAAVFRVDPNAVSGRLTELKRDGLVVKSGVRRPTRSGSMAAVVVAVR